LPVNLDNIQAAINEIGAPYAERREHIFEVTAYLEGEQVVLAGKVLEVDQVDALAAGLKERFPGLAVEHDALEVVRAGVPEVLSVASNLTSMHAEPSFLAEMVTQLVNGMEVEVLTTKDRWVYARRWCDPANALDAKDHYIGWTYRPYLDEQPAINPTHLVVEPVGLLRTEARSSAGLVTRVLGGTAAAVSEQREGWACLTLVGGTRGWLPDENLRALADFPLGEAEWRNQLVEDALRMIGVPYLWGGSSANGIDCSGFGQLLHRWIGISLPRDADMQYAAGQPVEAPFRPGDLIFFGERGEKRRITHVGISLGGWQMIHSSRSRNGVQIDDVQTVPGLRDSFLCAATYIGR
jgi:gamma-D-glutamyl-L-lysine dipeptidyl-peptidase